MNVIYLATFVILGGLLDTVEFGIFRVVQAYLSVAVSIAMLGLNTALTHQLPLFSLGQQALALTLTKRTILATSFIAGPVIYVIAPSATSVEGSAQALLYFISFPVAVMGASLCNVFLSVYQAQGDLRGYARLQVQWKTLVFVFGLVAGAVFFQAQAVLIAMAMAYGGVYVLSRLRKPLLPVASNKDAASKKVLVSLLFKNGVWPFASICVSVIYSNVEFFYIDSADLNSGVAGAYSLASLIFIGGAAFFAPLQTYGGSLVVNRKIELAGLLKLQLACLVAVSALTLAALAAAHGLAYTFPAKFNTLFLDFAVLVCFKLGIWGSFAVIGSVLNYVGKGFESFLLTVLCLVGLVTASLLIGVNSLRELVILQIVSSVVILFGSIYLVVDGYKGRPIRNI